MELALALMIFGRQIGLQQSASNFITTEIGIATARNTLNNEWNSDYQTALPDSSFKFAFHDS